MEAPHQIHQHARLCPCVLVVRIHPNKPEGDCSYVRQPSGITEEIWELQESMGVGKKAGRECQDTHEHHSLPAPYFCPSEMASLGQPRASLDIPAESSPSG